MTTTANTKPLSCAAGLLLGLLTLAASAPAQNIQTAQNGYGNDSPGDDASADAAPAADPAASQGYVRVIEGAVSVFPSGARDGAPAAVNQPVLPGDRVVVPEGSRAEIVLPDRNLLRLDGDSDVVLSQLAGSLDSGQSTTELRLAHGNAQLVVDRDALGDQLPRIDTDNATVYVQDPGVYRLTAEENGWSGVVVREGRAEVVSERGSQTVGAGDEAIVQGAPGTARVRRAGLLDPLERWGQSLESHVAADAHVDPDLRYEAAPLSRYGRWIEADGREVWQPNGVGADWRPYWHGSWESTPSGVAWVSDEPWGWVPYHYGTWDFVADYGWVWEPGTVYSPAWVYWYWGPSYVGWCPTGYYTDFYAGFFGGRRLFDRFHFGVYGWAGGDWGFFSRWNFVAAGRFGHRRLDRFAVPGLALRDRARLAALPRGIITTSTRGITPAVWSRPREAWNVLQQGGRGRQLADVTPFIARQRQLSPTVRSAVAATGRRDLTGTPLRPAALGGRAEATSRGRWAARDRRTDFAPRASGRGGLGMAGRTPSRPWDRGPAAGAGNTGAARGGPSWRERRTIGDAARGSSRQPRPLAFGRPAPGNRPPSARPERQPAGQRGPQTRQAPVRPERQSGWQRPPQGRQAPVRPGERQPAWQRPPASPRGGQAPRFSAPARPPARPARPPQPRAQHGPPGGGRPPRPHHP